MIRMQIRLDDSVFSMLRESARRQHRSMAACIRAAIEQFLHDNERERVDLSDVAGRFSPLPMDDIKGHDRDWAAAAMGGRRLS